MKITDGVVLKRKLLSKNLYEIQVSLNDSLGDYKAGNFVMLSLDNHLSPFLPRPFSIFDLKGKTLKLIFKVVGKGTELLSETQLPFKIKVWGPLGNSFPYFNEGENVIVAGGLGLVPLFNLGRHVRIKRVFIGYKDVSEAFLVKEINKRYNATISTDDGSLGFKGFITEQFEKYVKSIKGKQVNFYVCGPHPFLKKVWEIGKNYDMKNIFASFETVMACGFGVCLGCAIETPSGYVKVCKNGPVFNINEIFG